MSEPLNERVVFTPREDHSWTSTGPARLTENFYKELCHRRYGVPHGTVTDVPADPRAAAAGGLISRPENTVGPVG